MFQRSDDTPAPEALRFGLTPNGKSTRFSGG